MKSLIISSFHHPNDLLIGYFWSLEYHSTTIQIHRLSANFAKCPVQYDFSATTSFPLHSTHKLPFHSPHCCNQSLFFLFPSSPCFTWYNIANKTVLLKRLAHRVLSIFFALSTFFILINTFHPNINYCKISVFMSQHIFTIHPSRCTLSIPQFYHFPPLKSIFFLIFESITAALCSIQSNRPFKITFTHTTSEFHTHNFRI